jgi:hypothetical protein
VAGHRQARCLAALTASPRAQAAQAGLAQVFAQRGCQPPVVQTDRGPCFVGAEGSGAKAVPSRLTLWLWGLGIEHRLIPARRPQCNGAVERFHGGMEQNWRGEAGGLEALVAVWNVDKPPLDEGHRPYLGRAGFDATRVWTGLGRVQVQRQVDRDGKISLWDRSIRVAKSAAGQTVQVRFAADGRQLRVCDAHERLLAEVALPWLTVDWLWEPVPVADQARHPGDTSSAYGARDCSTAR